MLSGLFHGFKNQRICFSWAIKNVNNLTKLFILVFMGHKIIWDHSVINMNFTAHKKFAFQWNHLFLLFPFKCFFIWKVVEVIEISDSKLFLILAHQLGNKHMGPRINLNLKINLMIQQSHTCCTLLHNFLKFTERLIKAMNSYLQKPLKHVYYHFSIV